MPEMTICFYEATWMLESTRSPLLLTLTSTMFNENVQCAMKMCNVAEQPYIPENCSKQCLIFSSAKHNYILICITMQRKFEKIQRQDFKFEFKIPQTARGQKCHHILYYESCFKILLKRLDSHPIIVSCSPLRWL